MALTVWRPRCRPRFFQKINRVYPSWFWASVSFRRTYCELSMEIFPRKEHLTIWFEAVFPLEALLQTGRSPLDIAIWWRFKNYVLLWFGNVEAGKYKQWANVTSQATWYRIYVAFFDEKLDIALSLKYIFPIKLYIKFYDSLYNINYLPIQGTLLRRPCTS